MKVPSVPKSDIVFLTNDIKQTIEIIQVSINISRSRYDDGGIREACFAMKRALGRLDKTIENVTNSKNKIRNGKDKEFARLLLGLQYSSSILGSAWEDMGKCEELAPIF